MNNMQIESGGGTIMSDTQMQPQVEFEITQSSQDFEDSQLVQPQKDQQPIFQEGEFNESTILEIVNERGIDGALRFLSLENDVSADESIVFKNQGESSPEELVETVSYPDDPDFREHLLSVVSQKVKNGERINMDEVMQEARAKYENGDGVSNLPIEEKLVAFEMLAQDLIQERAQLKNENIDLNDKLSQKELQLELLAEVLLVLLKKKKEQEKQPKQKSWIEMLILLVGSLMQEVVTTGATEDKNKVKHESEPISPQFLIK